MYTNSNDLTFTLPSFTLPTLDLPKLYLPTISIPTLPRTTYVTTRKRRHVVDLGDVILGNPWTGTKQLQDTLRDADLAELIYVPILNRIVGTGLALKERTITPIAQGKPLTALVNIVESAGNTMDLFSNPIKSLLPWTGGGSYEDFLKSMGWLDGAYREQYQWNTGDLLIDLLGEIFSDPLTWVSLGTSAAVKAPAKGVAKELSSETIEQITKKLGKEVANDDTIRSVLKDKNITKILKNLKKEQLAAITDDLTSENSIIVRKIQDRIKQQQLQYANDIIKTPVGSAARKRAQQLYNAFNTAFRNIDDLTIDITKIRQSDLYAKYLAAKQLSFKAESFEKGLRTAGGFITGTSEVKLIYKKALTPAFSALYKNYTNNLKTVKPQDLVGSPNTVYTRIARDITAKNEAMYKLTYDEFKERLKYFKDVNPKEVVERLREIGQDVFKDAKHNTRGRKNLRKQFLERAIAEYPFLKYIFGKAEGTDFDRLFAPETLSKIGRDTIIMKQREQALQEIILDPVVVDELLDAFEEQSYLTNSARDTLILRYKAQVEQQFRDFFQTEVAEDIRTYQPMDMLTALNEKIIPSLVEEMRAVNPLIPKINTMVGLNTETLTMIADTDPNRFAALITLLNYVGINMQNIQDISNKLNIYSTKVSEFTALQTKLNKLNNIFANELDFEFKNLAKYTGITASESKLNYIKDTLNQLYDLKSQLDDPIKLAEYKELNRQMHAYYIDTSKLLNLLSEIKETELEIIKKEPAFKTRISEMSTTIQEILKSSAQDEVYKNLESALTTSQNIANKMLITDVVMNNFYNESYLKNTLHKYTNKHVIKITKNAEEFYNKIRLLKTGYTDAQLRYIFRTLDDNIFDNTIDNILPSEYLTEFFNAVSNSESLNNPAIKDIKDLVNMWYSSLENSRVLNRNANAPSNTIIDQLTNLRRSSKNFTATFNRYKELRKLEPTIPAESVYKYIQNTGSTPTTEGVVFRFLEDLKGVLNNTNTIEAIADTDFLLKHNTLYYPVLSGIGRYKLFKDSLDLAFDSEDGKQFLKDVVDKNSQLRRSLDTTIRLLSSEADEVDAPIAKSIAMRLNETVTKIDAVFAFYNYIDLSDVKGFYDLPPSVQQTLQGNLINAITTEFADYSIAAVDIDKVLEKLEEDLDSVYRIASKDNISNYISKEALLEQLEPKLSNYIDSLKTLQNANTDYNIRLFNVFDRTDLLTMNSLGEDYLTIQQLLGRNKELNSRYNKQTQIVFMNDVSSFIKNLAGERTKTEIKDDIKEKLNTFVRLNTHDELEANDEMIAIADIAQQRIIDDLQFDNSNQSIAWALAYTWNSIGRNNTELRGDPHLLGKLFGKNAGAIANITSLMTKEEVDAYIREVSIFNNIYQFNSANNYIAFKKVHIAPIDMNNIVIADSITKNQFILGYSKCYNSLAHKTNYNEYYIQALKNTLSTIYSKETTNIKIKDAKTFFYNLDNRSVLAWDRYTRSTKIKPLRIKYNEMFQNIIDMKKAAIEVNLKKEATNYAIAFTKNMKETILKRYDATYKSYNEFLVELLHENEIHDTLTVLEEISNDIQPEATAFDKLINKTDDGFLDTIDDILSETEYAIMRDFKSPQSIHNSTEALIKKSHQDLIAIRNNKVYKDIMTDFRLIKDVYPDLTEEQIQILKSYGINYNSMHMSDRNVLKLATHTIEHAMYDTIKEFTPEQLRTFVDHNTDGILLFYDPTSKFLNKYKQLDIKNAGLFVKELDYEGSGFYFIRRTDQTMHNAKIIFNVPKSKIKPIQDIIDKVQEALNYSDGYYYHREDMLFPMQLFTGDMLNKNTYDLLLGADGISELVGDLQVQKTYRKIDNLGENLFHAREIDRPNLTILGYEDATNNFINFKKGVLDAEKAKYAYKPTALDKLAWQGSTQAITTWNTEHKYLQLFFNDDFSLASPAFRRAFSKASDEEIKAFFDRNHYDACILKYNKAGRPTVYRINITNRAQLEDAIKQKAICLPHEAYRNVVLTVNKHKVTSKLVNAYQTVLVATFKTIYLSNPGFLMRNYLDSAIYKNLSSSNGLASFVDNFKYQYRARKMLAKYNEIVSLAYKDGTFNRDVVRETLSKLPEDEQNIYKLVDRFMNTGAGGGQAEALEHILLEYNKMHGATTPSYQWAEWYRTNILGKGVIADINSINKDIEQTSRLALFLNLIDNGEDFTNAIKKVIDTHFDYELKTPGLERLDQFFWFSTFPINNFFYYMNEGLEKNPDMFRAQLDLLQLSWNNGTDCTWDDVRNSSYLTYQALTGNIRFKIAGKNIVLKTGSSLLDFLNILINPIGEAKERLNPFLSVPLGFDSPKELNPLTTPINRINQIISGQSYLPSVYATLYPKYGRKRYYSNKYQRKSNWHIKTKKIPVKKASTISKQMRKRAYNFYTKRYYMKKWRPKLNRSISIEPYYNPVEGRTAGAYARYTRQMKKVGQNKKRH